MNLIFLDIDGVLNNLDPENVRHLNDLCVQADARIVVSSSWRNHGRARLARWLGAHGLQRPYHRVMATLPLFLPGDWIEWGEAERSDIYRGLEIEAWMLQNLDEEALGSTRIVILDDDGDMGRLGHLWVRTTCFSGPDELDPVKYRYTGPYNGLQTEHVDQALRLLEGQKPIGTLLAVPNPHWTGKARGALRLLREMSQMNP